MTYTNNTLFLRLAGPMQSWGTSSRFQLRRTDLYPSKSGVLGLLLCAKGTRREESAGELEQLNRLAMGVRVDRGGTMDWDYHTAGAKIGIRRADTGNPKETASTGEFETLLSRRQYLYDASFLVVLHGPPETIGDCADALEDPVWPIFLGRKCCIPSEPVFGGMGHFDTMESALSSVPWCPRLEEIDRVDRGKTRTLDTLVEHLPGSPPPEEARLVYDVSRVFGYDDHGPRWVVAGTVTVPVGGEIQKPINRWIRRRVNYESPQWKAARDERLKYDHYLCVFCKAPAAQVHHVDYTNVGAEANEDLRSLCKTCHDACTMLEYGRDMQTLRVDPADPEQRPVILKQVERLLTQRRLDRRREILESVRANNLVFFDDLPNTLDKEGQ